MSRKVKSVSFNLNDPWENKMYEHSLKFSNFSTFVKRLIQNSLSEKGVNTQQIKPVQNDEQLANEQVVIDIAHLKQLI